MKRILLIALLLTLLTGCASTTRCGHIVGMRINGLTGEVIDPGYDVEVPCDKFVEVK